MAPYCLRCLAHIDKFRKVSRARVMCIALSVTATVAVLIGFQRVDCGIFACIACLAISVLKMKAMTLRAKEAMRPNCACRDVAIKYSGWYGTVHEFWFNNATYVQRFAAANSGKLVGRRGESSLYSLTYRPRTGPARLALGCAILATIIVVTSAIFVYALRHTASPNTKSSVQFPVTPDTATPPPESAVPHYVLYLNRRFGFFILYPKDFTQEPAQENKDWLSLVSPDGRAQLSIWGGNNESGQTIDTALARAIEDIHSNITYQRTNTDWFVISWEDPDSDDIGYQKTFLGIGSINTFRFVYPIEQRAVYDPILTRIARSFKPGNLTKSW
jgi:hypothetical protein